MILVSKFYGVMSVDGVQGQKCTELLGKYNDELCHTGNSYSLNTGGGYRILLPIFFFFYRYTCTPVIFGEVEYSVTNDIYHWYRSSVPPCITGLRVYS